MKPGDKVVCVDVSLGSDGSPSNLVLNNVYVVKEVVFLVEVNRVALRLIGINPPNPYTCYKIVRFRKLDDLKAQANTRQTSKKLMYDL